MKQVVTKTSTYSSDEFGVCSALYELGGMVVMHDASGCNSTYTTHDEPRWYDIDSMIYISAISEMEAIMGDDNKFINDVMETAEKLKPAFIALVGAPIPYMTGTDFPAIARIVEEGTEIPCFGFQTNGMEYYNKGISMALETIADRFCTERFERPKDRIRVNILGATPLDLSTYGTLESVQKWLSDQGFDPGVCFAMGSSLEDLKKASEAHVNLVVSAGGISAAKLLEQRFKTPFVTGLPYGKLFSKRLARKIREAADTGISQLPDKNGSKNKPNCMIIGESVQSVCLAAAIEAEYPELSCKVLSPLDPDTSLLRTKDALVPDEEDLIRELEEAEIVMADPLYRMLCPEKRFFDLPHVAFSGRIYEKKIPLLTGDISRIREIL